jgi:hypothetical protein
VTVVFLALRTSTDLSSCAFPIGASPREALISQHDDALKTSIYMVLFLQWLRKSLFLLSTPYIVSGKRFLKL